MMNKSGYLYFYAEKGEYSLILHLSVLCASVVLKKVYLCVSREYYDFLRKKCNLPDNVEIYCIEPSDLSSQYLKRLDNLYSAGILRSNCPPVERHCINRWLYLQKKSFFGESEIFSFDWDTLVFPGLAAYERYLCDIDLAATNLMTLGWHKPPKEPIWSLCPNLLYLSRDSLESYVNYLDKYLRYSEHTAPVVADLFCDMQPWSSVISSALVGKTDLRLFNFNKKAHNLPLVDHNVRALYDCGLHFRSMRYYFQHGSATFLDVPYLLAKQIVFSDNEHPFFVLNKYNDEDKRNGLLPTLHEAAAIHFSGVEGKHLLLQTFIENISRYLSANLHHKHLSYL